MEDGTWMTNKHIKMVNLASNQKNANKNKNYLILHTIRSIKIKGQKVSSVDGSLAI